MQKEKQPSKENIEELVLAFLAEPIHDFTIENHGSIFIFRPLSIGAQQWVEENVSPEGFHPDWPTLVVEHRYASDLYQGILAAGFNVRDN